MVSKKAKYARGELRSKLLETAVEIISKQGIKKLTMRTLSQMVGVSRTAPYRYFVSKDALLFTLAKEGFEKLTLNYITINQNKADDSLNRLKNIGLTYIEFAINNPGQFRLMFGNDITKQKRSPELNKAASETFNQFLTAVEAYNVEYKTVSNDLTIFANYLWSTVHGLASLLIDNQILLSDDNYGKPTLFTDEAAGKVNDLKTIMVFSRQTLDNLWNLIKN